MLSFIFGTLVTSAIALLIAGPIGIGAALFLAELAPRRLATPVAMLIELLAAVPSVVYGLWGLFVLAPVIRMYDRAGVAARVRLLAAVPGADLRRRHVHRRSYPRDHGRADRRGDLARRVRSGAERSARRHARARRDEMGDAHQSGACRSRARASSALWCSDSAGRSAKRWRSSWSSATSRRSPPRSSHPATPWRAFSRRIFRGDRQDLHRNAHRDRAAVVRREPVVNVFARALVWNASGRGRR